MGIHSKLNNAAQAVAELIVGEFAQSLQDASPATQDMACALYLAAVDYEVEIIIDARELRDGLKLGQTKQQVLDAELFAMTERALNDLIDACIKRMGSDRYLGYAVDDAIRQLKESVRGAAA